MVFTITRDSKTGMVLPMAIGFHDPVIIAALNAIGTQDCRTARLIVDADAERAALLAQVFRVNRGFRCDDAHEALGTLLGDATYDDLYVVRGSRRMLNHSTPLGDELRGRWGPGRGHIDQRRRA